MDGRKKKTWNRGACMNGSALGVAGLPQEHHLPLLSLSTHLYQPIILPNDTWLSSAGSRDQRSAWPLLCPPPPILLLVTTAALFLVLAYLPTLRYLMLGQLDQVQQGNVLEGTHFLLRQRLPCLSREAFEHLGGNQYGGGFSWKPVKESWGTRKNRERQTASFLFFLIFVTE